MAWPRSQRMSSTSSIPPNGRILYVSNADEHNIHAYDVDHNGDTSNERVLVSRIDGVSGGISADEKGNLYVAAKGIAVYSPEGRLVHVMEMKELPSSCAFGEADDKSFFITAQGVVYRVRLDVKGAMGY